MRNMDIIGRWGSRPDASARIAGSPAFPNLGGEVDFYGQNHGVVVIASFWGLPYSPSPCANNLCALHIHEGGSCTGTHEDPFADALAHYNPLGCPHPGHAGDLPPLFSNRSYAWMGVYTERFGIGDIVGRTVIVHDRRDDFTSQPAGDAGGRIGCGVIRRVPPFVKR